MLRLNEQDRARLLKAAKAAESYQQFEDETGWEDWMNDFTDAEEGEVIRESEVEAINEILKEIYNSANE